MKQKIIWTLLLIFGVLSSFYSCNEIVEPVHIIKYRLTNKTGAPVSFAAFYRNEAGYLAAPVVVLQPDSVICQEVETLFGTVFEYRLVGDSVVVTSGIIAFSDSLVVRFDDRRQAVFTDTDDASPCNLLIPSNYDSEEIKEGHTLYSYVLTEKDVQSASLLNESSMR